MDTRLRTLLHDLATEMPVDIEGTAPKTLRRARGRRVLNGGTGAAIAVALVAVVSVSALRLGDAPTVTPAVPGPNPSATFEGLWPETDAEALAATQAAVDDGHTRCGPRRTGPRPSSRPTCSGGSSPTMQWPSRGRPAPRQRGRHRDQQPVVRRPGPARHRRAAPTRSTPARGASGASSDVSTPLIELDDVVALPRGPGDHARCDRRLRQRRRPVRRPLRRSRPMSSTGRSRAVARICSVRAHRPAVRPPSLGRADAGRAGDPAPHDARRRRREPRGGHGPGRDPGRRPGPPGPNLTGVPPDVAATAQRIYDAAKAKDFDALAELLDPNTFVYNLDDGTDPIPAWRADPSDSTSWWRSWRCRRPSRDIGGATARSDFWPYLVTATSPRSPQERDDLDALGYSDEPTSS